MESIVGRELSMVTNEVFPVYARYILYRQAFSLTIYAQWSCEKPLKINE